MEKALNYHDRLWQFSNLKINYVSVFTLPSHHCSKVLVSHVSCLPPLQNVMASDRHCFECYG